MYHVDLRISTNFTVERTLHEIFQSIEMLTELYAGLEVLQQTFGSWDTQNCSCTAQFILGSKYTGIWYLLQSCVSDFEAIHGHLIVQLNRLQDLLVDQEVISEPVHKSLFDSLVDR